MRVGGLVGVAASSACACLGAHLRRCLLPAQAHAHGLACTHMHNHAGGVCVVGNASASITGVTLELNSAALGGAVFADTDLTERLSLQNVTFDANSALLGSCAACVWHPPLMKSHISCHACW